MIAPPREVRLGSSREQMRDMVNRELRAEQDWQTYQDKAAHR
jgi:hypothetical protein